MRNIATFCLSLLFLCTINISSAQKSNIAQVSNVFTEYEDTLKILGKNILHGKTDLDKYAANEIFINLLEEALCVSNSYEYPFDSLITIARLVAPDNSFRIFNWNIPRTDGTYEYYGFIQKKNKKSNLTVIHRLKDSSDEIENPELKTLSCDNWYGAHYYKIILTKVKSKKYYTILGWDGNNLISTKKIIEILSFDSKGEPKFGYSLFKCDRRGIKRYFFEYSADVSMSLKYEEQSYDIVKKSPRRKVKKLKSSNTKNFRSIKKDNVKYKKGKKKKEKSVMIIFDHLTPLDPKCVGMYNFYVPETNVFDAFVFKNNKWRFYEDVDARNPEIPDDTDAKPKKKIEYNLFPEKDE